MRSDVVLHSLQVQLVPQDTVEVLVHPQTSGTPERLIDGIGCEGLPAMDHVGQLDPGMRHNEHVHMVPGDRETAQVLAFAMEMVQGVAQDAACFRAVQNARSLTGIEPGLHTMVEQAVPLQLHQVPHG